MEDNVKVHWSCGYWWWLDESQKAVEEAIRLHGNLEGLTPGARILGMSRKISTQEAK